MTGNAVHHVLVGNGENEGDVVDSQWSEQGPS